MGATGAGAVQVTGGGETATAGVRTGAVRAGGGAHAKGGQGGGQDGQEGVRHGTPGIGARLARAREAAGLSVAELSRRTRIREPVIRAMEHDDFSMAGGDFYARGHLRGIARVVGLDPEAIVHEYDEQYGGVPMPVRAAEVFLAEIPIKLRERRSVNWTTAMAVVLVMVVAFGVARMISGSGGVDPTSPPRPAVTPAARPAGAATPAAAAPTRRPTAAAVAAGTVAVRVTADRSTRLTVRDGQGKRLFRGVFQAGSTSEWRAKGRIEIVAADAGAVRLVVDGKDLGPAGRPGERVTRSFRAKAPGPR